MEKEKLQHYSIRKLSVGAASVLIGLSFVGMGHSTQVKADTVNENQQQVVKTPKNENTSVDTKASLDNIQVNDSKNKLNINQIQSDDKVANTATTMVNRKSVQGEEREQLNANSSVQNDVPENGAQSATALRVSQNKEKIVENNKNKVEATTLNLNQKVDPQTEKANLAESKVQVQNQGNNDLATTTDPSKLSKDDFADGTRWTAAGWTRTDPNTKVAKSSTFTYDDVSPDHLDFHDFYLAASSGGTIKATLNKDDIVKGNKILLAAIQSTTGNKQNDQHMSFQVYQSPEIGGNTITFQGKDLGNITADYSNNEVDYWLNITDTIKYATDPEFIFHSPLVLTALTAKDIPVWGTGGGIDYVNASKDVNKTYYIVTNSQIKPITLTASSEIPTDLPSGNLQKGLYNDPNSGNEYSGVAFNNLNANDTLKGAIKVQDTAHILTKGNVGVMTATAYYPVYNNKMYLHSNLPSNVSHNPSDYVKSAITVKTLPDNLNAADAKAQISNDMIGISWQNDGSYIIAYNYTPTAMSKNGEQYVRDIVTYGYSPNFQLKDQKQEVIDQTIEYYRNRNWIPTSLQTDFILPFSSQSIPTVVTVTDLSTGNAVTSAHNVNGSKLNAELYRNASVSYFDDVTSKTINTDVVVGRKNLATDYMVNIPSGYVLADNQDGTNYKWNADKTKVTYTFADDQKQNDSNPIVIHLTHGRKDIVDTNTISETIHYQFEDGSKAADDYNAKSLASSRLGHKDLVTGQTIWDSDWSQETFPEVNTPHINGYTADIAQIAAQTVDGTSQDIVKTVIYKANNQKIFVHYIDDDVNGQDLHTDPLVGKSNTTANYTTGDAIKNYLNQGYDLVSDDTQGKALRYDADDEHDQVYNVHLKHHISDVTDPKMLNATFDRVITETLPDGKQKQITQHYVITRTGKQDQVTKKYAFTNWSSAQVHEDKGDALDGYTAKINSANIDGIALVDDSGVPTVKAEKFTNENNNSTTPVNVEERVEVGYLPDDQKATITFIDDDAQKDKQILQTQNLVGKSNTKSSYDTGADIENYLSKGFELVSDDTQGNPITFDAHDKVDQVFTVHLKHHISDVTDPRVLTATFDRVITEHTPDGKDKQITQHYVITRTGKQDQVTKKYAWSDWTTVQVHEDKGDTFEGYTPHLSGNNLDSFISLVNGTPIAKAETYTNENGKLLPKNISEKVYITYTANPQEAAIVFYDDTADIPLQKNTVRGHYGEAIEFTPKVSDVITEYTKKGYVLVSNEFDNQKYAADDKQNVFVVHLKHGTMDVTRSKDVTETIHYVYDNNSKAHDDYVTTKKFENHGVKDLVTGETKWDTNWTPENDQFAQVNSPEIPGYTADKENIPAQTVNADSKNLEYTVTYTQTPAPTPYEPSDPVQPAQPTQPDVQPSTPVVPDQPVDQDNSNKSESTPTKKVVKVKKNKIVSDSLVNNSVSDKQDSYLPSDYGNYVAKDESTDVQSPKVVARGSLPKTTEVKSNAKELPTTGAKDEDQLSYVGLALAGLVGMFGYSIKKRKD